MDTLSVIVAGVVVVFMMIMFSSLVVYSLHALPPAYKRALYNAKLSYNAASVRFDAWKKRNVG